MCNLLKRYLWLATVVVLPIQFCPAQGVPSGLLTVCFSTNGPLVYDLSGDYPLNQQIMGLGGTMVNLGFQVSLVHKSQGSLKGSGVTFVSVGPDIIAGTYTANGTVSKQGGITHMKLQVHIHNGREVVAGLNTPFNINVRYDFEVETNGLIGTAKGNANFSDLGGGKIDTTVTNSLPVGVDGTWCNSMNLLALTKIRGTGVIVLSNGRTLSTRVSGNVNQSSGITRANFNGVAGSPGTTMRMDFFTDTNNAVTVVRLKGKMMGQTFDQ